MHSKWFTFRFSFLAFFALPLASVFAEDYLPQVPKTDPTVCYKEIEVCRAARELRDLAVLETQQLRTHLDSFKSLLDQEVLELESLEIELSQVTLTANNYAFALDDRDEPIRKRLNALHRRLQRLDDQNASPKRLRTVHKRIQKAQRERGDLLNRVRDEYIQAVQVPLEEEIQQRRAALTTLQKNISELQHDLTIATQEEQEFEIYAEGFCTSYLAMCLPPVGLQCLGEVNQSQKPDPILFPEFADPLNPAHGASILFRVKRDCASGAMLGREDIIVLDGTQCDYVCRTRLPEDCFADGSFDSYTDERCYGPDGNLIELVTLRE